MPASRPPDWLPVLYFRQWSHTIFGVSCVKPADAPCGFSRLGPTEQPDVDPAHLTLVKYPEPVLRKVCAPVADFDDTLARIAARMLAVMHEHNGVGLAGPQIGLGMRLFVCNPTGGPEDDRVYVNPELADLDGFVESEEGCLSIPEVNVMMRRARVVTVAATTVAGEPVRERAEDLLARVWQHEIDHLDGKLIIDHMSEADRLANRRALKQLEEQYAKRRPRSRSR
jgi:peptide deformylase